MTLLDRFSKLYRDAGSSSREFEDSLQSINKRRHLAAALILFVLALSLYACFVVDAFSSPDAAVYLQQIEQAEFSKRTVHLGYYWFGYLYGKFVPLSDLTFNLLHALIGGLAVATVYLFAASITGSIIGNILLVFGLAALAGGLRRGTLRFNRTAAAMGTTMLLLATISLIIPAIFHRVAGETAPLSEHRMSLLIAVVLLVTYLLSLVFTLKTHSHLYTGSAEPHNNGADHGAAWSVTRSVWVLLASAVAIGVMSELLVSSVEQVGDAAGMSEVFIGVILVAIIGNAAEHSTAVIVALKNKMDLSINIAVGSSLQIALFVAPVLVFLSYFIGPQPMDLLFTTMEVVAIAASVGIMAVISQDGETHWMEGVQLLAVYAILAVAFFFVPA